MKLGWDEILSIIAKSSSGNKLRLHLIEKSLKIEVVRSVSKELSFDVFHSYKKFHY